jgi:ribonuclease E
LQEPVAPASIEMAEIPVTDEEEIEDNGEPHEAGAEMQGDQPQGDNAGRKRRRRRRRGGRGRNRDNNDFVQAEIAPPPGDGASADTKLQDAAEIATPNTASEPMWSLGNDAPVVRQAEPVAAEPEPVKAPEPERIAEPLPQQAAEPSKPPRKGWWQRTFSAD